MQKKNFTYTIFLFCSLLPTSSATMEKQLCKSPSVTIRDNAYVGITPFIPTEYKSYIAKPYACDQCDKSFTQNSNLKTHIRFIHTKERPYTCDMCPKSFTQNSNLKNHIRHIHTKEKPYTCDMCPKSFTQNSNLKSHIRHIHTKEKPYACNICSNSFCDAGSLIRHRKMHTEQMPYSCAICPKKFNAQSNYVKHIQSHPPIKSPVIEKNFVNFELLSNNNTLPINNEHNIDDAAFLQWIEQ